MIIKFKNWLKFLVVKKNNHKDAEMNNLNFDKLMQTIPTENKRNPIKNYSIIGIVFIAGLMFVSVIKNETRNLQKNINSFQQSINNLKVDLHQETLDHEIITSPENLTLLAKEYLDINLIPYKRLQINTLKNEKEYVKSKNTSLKTKLENNLFKRVEEKKLEIAKLKKIYSNPKDISGEIKLALSKKIESKKIQLYNFYKNPKEAISMNKSQRWAFFQVVKLFMGIPVVPGK
jgi:hypothetical protein